MAGQAWLERYTKAAKSRGIEVPLHPCDENFRFGASRVFHASYLATIMFQLRGSTVMIRVSIVNGEVPLLLSRSVLAELGMVFDMANLTADFRAVDVSKYRLLYTETGHPALPVNPQKSPNFVFPDPQQWGTDEIKIIPSRKQQYTAFVLSGADSRGPGSLLDTIANTSEASKLFSSKKVSSIVHNMLTADILNPVLFSQWWSETQLSNDFWIETREVLYRIHVIPRKSLFRPDRWTTPNENLRTQLLSQIGSIRSTRPVACNVLIIEHRRPSMTCGMLTMLP